MSWFVSWGQLLFSEDDGIYSLKLSVDEEIANLYRSFIPKSLRFNRPRYPAHITIVRNEILKDINGLERKELYYPFLYSNVIERCDTYIWLPVRAIQLQQLRVSLGLEEMSEWTRPPTGEDCFHITIGNTKGLS